LVAQNAMVAVDRPYDVVITTNSGYPLDQNLYQSVKGMSAAAQIVRAGGAVVAATACADGLPEHGKYAALLARAGSPSAVLGMITEAGFAEHDQWTVQVQAQIQQRCEVHVRSDGLTDEQIRRALFLPCRSVEATVAALLERFGRDARLAVLPEGPQTIPYIRSEASAGRG
jgi:nickel-dependent lactate racemase